MKSTTLIRPLNPLTDNLTEIAGLINQAYRGRESWTNENGLISGPRVRVDELMNMDDTVLLLVLNKEDSQSSPDAAADDSSSPPPPPRVIGTLQISLGKGEEDEEETVREGRQQQYSSGSAPDQHSHNAELGLFSIHPSFQRRGLGKMLLMHGIEYAKSRNKAGACMWVLERRSELISYYLKMGFKRSSSSSSTAVSFPQIDKCSIDGQSLKFIKLIYS